jgi:LmbE family N-acetylglucosaminyl deacetylase
VQGMTRREALSGAAALAALAADPLAAPGLAKEASPVSKKLKIVVLGAHPDDPESGCGGTIAACADAGHDVVALYLTRGEAGIRGKTHDEAATIRTAEAEQACKILHARPVFLGQIDGATEVTAQRYDEAARALDAEQPDVLIAHWPIDTHRDHRAASLLAYDAWLRADKRFALYYFEVMSGAQTQQFWPTHYVDITRTEPRKREACLAHVSQHAKDGFYPYHERMQRFRGMEADVERAEAFVRHPQSHGALI